MPGLRRSLPLLAAAALACTGKVDTTPSARPAPRPAPAAGPTEPPPPDPADTLAATLTEEKLKRLLAFEEALLPTSAAMVALASAPGAGGRTEPGEPTKDDRQRALDGQLGELLQKHGLTRADHAGFAALSSGLVLRSARAEDAREQLAKNAENKKAWAKLEAAEAGKKHDPRRPPWFMGKEALRPLPEPAVQHLQTLVVQADADRGAFKARHGEAALALLDRYRPQILALREKQVRIVTGAAAQ